MKVAIRPGVEIEMDEPQSWPTMGADIWNPSEHPFIPPDVLAAVMGAALDKSLTAQFMEQHAEWQPGAWKRPRWFVRYWRRIDRYLPRVSVHIGPKPCYRKCCDE